jgi:UDP:flavonoid glycosyltransferase YjiC (YdhE family)
MSRFLFVSLPLTGHVHPIGAVARELERRGHTVAWAGSEGFLRPLIGPDAPVYPIPLRAHRGHAERGMAATRSRWAGYIVPHARTTGPGVEHAIADFRPDALAVDQHALAGAIAGHRHALPWATLAPTSMELTRPLRALPRVEAWIGERLCEAWSAAAMPGEPPHDLRFSPHLLIAFTGAALVGESWRPPGAKLVGPALTPRADATRFPFDWLEPGRRHVLVTMGTLAADMAGGFYRRALEALRPLGAGVQAVVAAPPDAVPDPPDHVLVRPRVPVLDLLPRMDAVVGHGGLNTVCEALYHGVPLVIAPIRGDQPVNAEQVAEAKAGVRVRFAGIRPEPLREALLTVLDDPAYRAAAERVGATLRAAGGAGAAAGHLERLARDQRVSGSTEGE